MKLVVHGLIDKRAELVREVTLARESLCEAEGRLATIETAIRLFDPDISFDNLPKRRLAFTVKKRGRSSRAALDVLRAAGRPLTVREIALAILERHQLSRTDPVLLTSMINRVSGAMRRLRKLEQVKAREVGARGMVAFWLA